MHDGGVELGDLSGEERPDVVVCFEIGEHAGDVAEKGEGVVRDPWDWLWDGETVEVVEEEGEDAEDDSWVYHFEERIDVLWIDFEEASSIKQKANSLFISMLTQLDTCRRTWSD